MKAEVTVALLKNHFQGKERGDLVGLHTTSANNKCRWVLIDIDQHKESDHEMEQRNQAAAIALYEKLQTYGITALLTASNGCGGFHLLVLFEQPMDSEIVFEFGRSLVHDWQDLGLICHPEVFPKQSTLKDGKLGNWVRLPGLHHTRDFYSEVWSGSEWLSGQAAINVICDTQRVPPKLLHEEETELSLPSIKESEEFNIADDDENRPVRILLSKLRGVTTSGFGWMACCPAHNDHTPSLSVWEKEGGRVDLHCYVGCNKKTIVEKIGLTMADLLPKKPFDDSDFHFRRHFPIANPADKSTVDFTTLQSKFIAALAFDKLSTLASQLGVTKESLQELSVGWFAKEKCWTFPECDEQRHVIGIMRRYKNGEKRFIAGGKRGLYIPKSLDLNADQIMVVEGGSDTAAALTLEWNVIGRPFARGGVPQLIQLLKATTSSIYILGDNDPKRNGTWPGRRGAEVVAKQLQAALRAEVLLSGLPMEFKDIRAYVQTVEREP